MVSLFMPTEGNLIHEAGNLIFHFSLPSAQPSEKARQRIEQYEYLYGDIQEDEDEDWEEDEEGGAEERGEQVTVQTNEKTANDLNHEEQVLVELDRGTEALKEKELGETTSGGKKEGRKARELFLV